MRKKFISSIILVVVIGLVVGCSALSGTETSKVTTLKVGATPVPHGELLKLIKDDLNKEGIELEIVEFTDYVKPNLALNDEEIDANFFQHVPYLDNFNSEHNLTLKSVGTIHVEPLGVYSNTIDKITDLEDGSIVAIPADSVNGARALLLLESNGLLTLDDEVGLEATEKDINRNPKNLKFKAIEAAQIPRVLQDVTIGVINGNYAIEAGINPLEDALILEDGDSPYANIVTTRVDNQESEAIQTLLSHLQSDKVKEYILETYDGAVVPAFDH